MTILNTFVSGTQFVGNMANYWHIFVMVIILIILLFIFYSSATAKRWPPPCGKDGKPPEGETSCSISKTKLLLILGFIILLLMLFIYFSWEFRDNKLFQTAQGIGVEGDILRKVF